MENSVQNNTVAVKNFAKDGAGVTLFPYCFPEDKMTEI